MGKIGIISLYNWNEGETTLPVTILKDGEKFAEFTAARSACDAYQQQWCNADYEINKTFPASTYTTKISSARQCLKPGGTGTVRLYGTEATTKTTATTATVSSSSTPATNTSNACNSSSTTSMIIGAVGGFLLALILFKRK